MDYYNQVTGFNLRSKRIKNLRMVRGDQLEENALYHYQTPFKSNQLYVAMDAIIAYVVAAMAEPEVYPANKSTKSRLLAEDLLNYMKAHSEKFEVEAILEEIVLNLETDYIGLIALDWDPDYGEKGEIIPRIVGGENCIIDKNAKRGHQPQFFCEVMKDSIEGLIAKFPKKEQDILKLFGIKRKGTQNTSKELAYRQVYFLYYDKKKVQQMGVCWYVQDLVLDKRKNPNWLYEGEGKNFLDNPMIPYIPFNLFNKGSHWIDFTSSLEQAVPVQDIVNKEGRQIIDNLGTANGFRIVLAGAMTDDALENLTGDPNQSVIVKAKPGQKIDDVYKQIEPHLISTELIADKNANIEDIHSIMATPSQFRGDDTDQTKTASEANLIKNQASGRQDKIVRALNRGMGAYYRFLAQMICVWYTDDHSLTAESGDGSFDFLEMHANKIENGMSVRVYSQPSADKARLEAIAQNAFEAEALSPIDYYKFLRLPNPQKLYDNLVDFKNNPQKLQMNISNDNEDRDAIMDFADLMNGQKVDQRSDITPQYLDQFRKEMITDEFLDEDKTDKKTRDAIIKFIKLAQLNLAVRTELDEASDAPLPPPPLPPEIQATLPPPQPMMPGLAGAPMQPMGAPAPGGAPAMPQVGVPPMGGMPPQAPPTATAPAPMPPTGPLPAGIQGALQMANAPSLNPNTQPMPPQSINSLTPR
jgi:hypothetical protein